jgi:FAD/FMN-containing dehydrogenase
MMDQKHVEAFKQIVGDDYVTASKPIRVSYVAKSIMDLDSEIADVVIRPNSVEEVQKILIYANDQRIPVTPQSKGLSGGTATPAVPGGILLDLSRMDQILEVDTDSRYMVVEPGVSNGKIWGYFREHYPDWVPPIPDGAPSQGSVMGNTLDRGFSVVTSKYGPQADLVLGLEVVLPTGEIIRTGSWVLPGAKPFYRWGIGPDMTGLFLGAQGTMGVVTKLATQIVPHMPYIDIVLLGFGTPEELQDVSLDVLKQEIGVMVQGGPWWLVPGVRQKEELKEQGLLDINVWREKKYYVPNYMMNFEIWAKTEAELVEQQQTIKQVVEDWKKKGANTEILPIHPKAKATRLKKPNKIAIPYASYERTAEHGGGFLFITWYLPWKDTAKFCHLCEEYMPKYGFDPIYWVASIKNGRDCIGMPIVCYNAQDPESENAVNEFDKETSGVFLDHGWLNYRPRKFVHAPMMYERAPEYFTMLLKFKKLLDPNGIMHPGSLNMNTLEG